MTCASTHNPSFIMKHMIVAAHSDDAALSIGGFLSDCADSKTILNVFSTCAFTVLPELHSPDEITKLNNDEEMQFAEQIGSDVLFLHESEALLRGYTHWQGTIDQDKDARLIRRLMRSIESAIPGYTDVYFPLAIGDHIDHKILLHIGRRLAKSGLPVFFYEDLPYAAELTTAALAEYTGDFAISRVVDISGSIDRKLDLCALYRSQYDRPWLEQLRSYASRVSAKQGRFAERLWRLRN